MEQLYTTQPSMSGSRSGSGRDADADIDTHDNNNDEYALNDGEFNLARMQIETIKKAFRLYPQDLVTKIAERLCISPRTLHRKIKQYNLGSPRDLRFPDKIKKVK